MTKGILKDPWRYGVSAYREKAPPSPEDNEKPKGADYVPNRGDNEDEDQLRSKSVHYPNYGGITVSGVSKPEMIASALLQFFVDNRTAIEDMLTEYGVLVVKLQPGKLNLPFYIARADGWTLTIPDAEDRMQGLLALIQCLLRLDELPKMRTAMRDLGIQPFRF